MIHVAQVWNQIETLADEEIMRVVVLQLLSAQNRVSLEQGHVLLVPSFKHSEAVLLAAEGNAVYAREILQLKMISTFKISDF